MTNVDELQRALNLPQEKWTVFLHPEQRPWIDRDYAGQAPERRAPASRVALRPGRDPRATVRLNTRRDVAKSASAWFAGLGIAVHSADHPAASPAKGALVKSQARHHPGTKNGESIGHPDAGPRAALPSSIIASATAKTRSPPGASSSPGCRA